MRMYLSCDCLDVKLSTGKPKHTRLLRYFFRADAVEGVKIYIPVEKSLNVKLLSPGV